MVENYTQSANNHCFDLFDSGIETVWADLGHLAWENDADKWKVKLTKISEEYSFSSRFALMRLSYCWAKGIGVDEGHSGDSYAVSSSSRSWTFEEVSITHAQHMGEEELLHYEDMLMERASLQVDFDPTVSRRMISRALKSSKSSSSLITREEALTLGHILQLSLQEMQWFLLRVFDFQEGFQYSLSEDLIEAFAFLTKSSWQQVEEMKKEYARSTAKTRKIGGERRAVDWTLDVQSSLYELVEGWKNHSENGRQGLFLEWMREQAPLLDLPSRTATRVYRSLAVHAYKLLIGAKMIHAECDVLDELQEAVRMETPEAVQLSPLFSKGILSEVLCEEVAGRLLYENKEQTLSTQTDLSKAWGMITTNKNGKPTAAGTVNENRKRVSGLIRGELSVEKCDMLYLLFFVFNISWQLIPDPDNDTRCQRLMDFIDLSEACLNAALLSPFYPPHLLEQSLMLSIVMADNAGIDMDDNVPVGAGPAQVYEIARQSLREPKMKVRNNGNRELKLDNDQKLKAVLEFLSQQDEISQTEYAKRLGVNMKTFSGWVRKYAETERI